MITTYMISGQRTDMFIREIRRVATNGSLKGAQTVTAFGRERTGSEEEKKSAMLASVMLTTDLSQGFHLTAGRKEAGRILQKSILTTFYLGEKTIDIRSAIQTDIRLLSQISNTMAVDIFAYLNQSGDRARSLESYLNLLKILRTKAEERSTELQSQISFLTANFRSQEQTIVLTEDAFFENLKMLNGENAEEALSRFIGIGQEQTEVRAKIGAYRGIKDYYDFFLPRLNTLILAIENNRGPLIAGVRVVEIQNMTLPLIIRER